SNVVEHCCILVASHAFGKPDSDSARRVRRTALRWSGRRLSRRQGDDHAISSRLAPSSWGTSGDRSVFRLNRTRGCRRASAGCYDPSHRANQCISAKRPSRVTHAGPASGTHRLGSQLARGPSLRRHVGLCVQALDESRVVWRDRTDKPTWSYGSEETRSTEARRVKDYRDFGPRGCPFMSGAAWIDRRSTFGRSSSPARVASVA